MVRIALVGDFNRAAIAHQGIVAIPNLAPGLAFEWNHTGDLQVSRLKDYAGIWCVPGSPFANEQAALDSIRYAAKMTSRFSGLTPGSNTLCWSMPATCLATKKRNTPRPLRVRPTR